MSITKIIILITVLFLVFGFAQQPGSYEDAKFEVISQRKQLKRIVPASFYFAGLSGGTQMRNSAVGKLGDKRFIVAGMVDVSGYSTEISGVYEGFFITDSPIMFGDKELPIGAYGIGFAKKGYANLFDLSSKKILSASTTKDTELRRPRPLMMKVEKRGIRLYKGRDYVIISPN